MHDLSMLLSEAAQPGPFTSARERHPTGSGRTSRSAAPGASGISPGQELARGEQIRSSNVSFVLKDQMTGSDRQRETLIASLRVRFARALADNDAEAKAALFKEAVYLGIQPDVFTGSDLDPTA